MTTYRLGRPAGLRSATFRHPHAAQPARARVSQCRGDFSIPQAAPHRRAALLGIHGRHRRRDHSCRGPARRNCLDTHWRPRWPQQHVGRHGGCTGHVGGLDPRHPGARPQEARPTLVAPSHRGAGGHAEAVPPVVSHRPHRAGRRRQAHFRRAERPSPQRADWRWRIEGSAVEGVILDRCDVETRPRPCRRRAPSQARPRGPFIALNGDTGQHAAATASVHPAPPHP